MSEQQLNYLLRREVEERKAAEAATDAAARLAHRSMADSYSEQASALNSVLTRKAWTVAGGADAQG